MKPDGTNTMITLADIDHLLRYLPRLRALEGAFVRNWEGGTADEKGLLTFPWPRYHPVVEEFFREAGKEPWSDFNYDPAEAGRMIADPVRVAQASLDEIRTMLTWSVRGERFGDGHWASVLSSGRLFAVLERLNDIRGTIQNGTNG